jgi:hypothetical protein
MEVAINNFKNPVDRCLGKFKGNKCGHRVTRNP